MKKGEEKKKENEVLLYEEKSMFCFWMLFCFISVDDKLTSVWSLQSVKL